MTDKEIAVFIRSNHHKILGALEIARDQYGKDAQAMREIGHTRIEMQFVNQQEDIESIIDTIFDIEEQL